MARPAGDGNGVGGTAGRGVAGGGTSASSGVTADNAANPVANQTTAQNTISPVQQHKPVVNQTEPITPPPQQHGAPDAVIKPASQSAGEQAPIITPDRRAQGAQEKPAKTSSPRQKVSVDTSRHTLLQAIAIKGVDATDPLANDLRKSLGLSDGKNMRVNIPGHPPMWLFRKNGKRLDTIAGELSQSGERYLDAHDRQEMLDKLYDNPDHMTPEGTATKAQREYEAEQADHQAGSKERFESTIATHDIYDETTDAEWENILEDGRLMSAEEADKFFAEPAENQEHGNDQQRTAQEARKNDAGGIAENGTSGAQETGGKAFGLAGQTNEEINAAAQAEHEAEIAKIKAERDAANKRAKEAEEQLKADNTSNGNAADAFSMTQPEPVSKAQQKAIDKKKAETELVGQSDLLSQSNAPTSNQSEFEKIGMVRSGDSWRWKGNVDGDAYDSVTVRPWKGGFTVTTGGYFNSPLGGNALPTKEIGTFKTESEAVSAAKEQIASKQVAKEDHTGQPSISATENNPTDAAKSEFSTLERDLISKAHDKEYDGDVGVVVGGGKVKFVPIEDAIDAAKKAIASGVKAVPFQIHNATGIRIGDVPLVLEKVGAEFESTTKESQNANSLQTKHVSQRASGEDQSYVADGHRDSQPMGAGLAEHGQGLDHNRGVSGSTQGAGTRGNQGETGARAEPSTELGEGRVVRPESEPASGVNRHETTTEEGTDHVIDADEIGKGGLGKKYRDNIAAIKILNTIEADGRDATPEERKALSKYVGWGAMKGLFDPNNKTWAKQHDELKELLTDEEFRAARASTLDAHYTSPEVVNSMYDALSRLGFKSGRVLEPSVGVGNFFGLMPREMRNSSQLYGVELDSLTSRLVSALYPKAKIAKATGFQDFEIPSEYFDVVIGNPPFGSYPLVDKERSPYSGFSIHNYFLAKSIDKLRPGGIMAVVVSHNFLDAQDSRVRKWIGERAGLVGGVRLPNTAFKDNAGTEVVTDILIFQKHDKDGLPDSIAPWQDVVGQININPKTGEHATHNVNQFFVANPQYVLGKPSAGGTMYSANEYTVEQDGDIKNALAKWAKALPENMFDNIDRASDAAVVDMAVPDGIKIGSYYVDANGKVMQRGNDLMGNKTAVAWEPRFDSQVGRMKGMIAIRDALRKQMRLERSVDATEQDIEANRAELNRLYDDFFKKYKHLNSTTNRSVFLDDPESHLIQGLEFDYDKGIGKATAEKEGIEQREASATKADIFRRRVSFPPNDHMTVTTAKDALLASLNYRGKVDPAYMSEVYGKPMDEIVKELGDVVFDDPQSGIVTADEYLSGDVKTKLDEAKYAAQDNAKYRRNVEALEKVIPKDKTPSEISVSIGASFVPADVYEQFVKHISGGSATASYIKATGQWLMAFNAGNDPSLNTGRFGTSDMSAQDLFQLTMMGRGAVVKKTMRNSDGSTTTILMEKETEAAREKQNAIKAEWQKWLWQDPERADRIASIYNDKMNRIVGRKYDGSHMSFPGMNPSYSLLAHQKNGVWRGLQTYQVLYDHVVGAGKTFEMATLAMEMRRLGIARKPLVVVPNHLTLQFRSDFTRLYPGSDILVAAPEDFSKDNRERLFAKIITGDWDAVVIGHSSLKKIGLPEKTELAVLQEQISELTDSIEDMKRARGDKRITADMERIRKNLDAKMRDKLAAVGKRSKMVTFDELGVDAMFIDEMHEFKNLAYNTTMDRNPGMGNPAGSAKAFDLFVKTRWLFDTFGDKTPFITATGTPISNSLVEMFNMQRYMQYPTLKRQGLNVFDAWAKQFGSVENVYEVSPSGSGYRQSTRFAKFTNLPALMSLYNTFADTVTLDDLKAQEEAQGNRFPVPKMVGGRPVLVVAKRSPSVAALMGVPEAQTDEAGNILFGANLDSDIQIKQDEKSGKWTAKVGDARLGTFETEEDARLKVVESALTPVVSVDSESILGRFANLRQLTKETKGRVNALSLTGEANKAGLDYRLIDPKAPDFPGSKINLAVDNMMRIYKQWDADKGTQLVFCDLSIPLSARSSYSNKSRRLYVRDEARGIEMKRGTMHAMPGHEDLPYFVVQRGDKESKRFDVYDAASGLRLQSDFRSKQDAIDAAIGFLSDEDKRQKWINAREATGEIEQGEIDEYNNENDIDVDDPSMFFTRDDVAGVSGSAKFSVYDDIKAKLIAKGVPEHEIAFIHDYNTPTAKDKLFKAVNHGGVRFLLGSTPKMGAGTNVQERLVGLHHIDAPWRPSDLEQREGRIIRRGNKLYERDPENFEVFIGRYATEQTYDTRRWQILEHKARGIEQLRNYDGTLNEIDDIEGEAANAADMKAAASGDPLILEETKLRTDVRRLENLQAAYADEVLSMTRKSRSAQEYADKSGPAFVREIRESIGTTAKHPVDKDGFAPISVQGGKALSDKDAANKALASVFENVRSHMIDTASIQYRGLEFELKHVSGNVIMYTPTGIGGTWGATDTFSPSGMVQRLKNYIDRLPAMLDDTLAGIEKSKKDAASMRELAKQPFPQAADLERAREAHKKVQRALMAKGPEVPDEQKAAVVSGIEQQKAKLRELGFGDALNELSGSAKYSRSATLARNPHTESTLRDAINSSFPGTKNFADSLIATGKFHIIGSEDIGKHLGQGANFSKASQTDTPAFKKWFGDSKVVDSDGNPLVVSHFTDADDISVFDRGRLGSNTESNTDQEQASKMARLGFWFSDSDIRYTHDRGRGVFADNKIDAFLAISHPKEYATFDEMWHESDSYETAKEWRTKLEHDGYDGVVVRDDNELGGTSYVAFHPNQIKSATGNIGAFDQTNHDIRYSKDGRILAFVKNGETFFVHDNISQTDDSVKGLLLHELGDHALMLGRTDAEFKNILRQFKMMGNAGNEKVIEAQARVPEGTPAHFVDEESLGYFLEANPELPFSQRVIAWFRDALRKLGEKLKGIQKLQWIQWANRLNESDIVYMATQATRGATATLRNSQDNSGKGVPLFSKQAQNDHYEVQPDAARNLPIDGAELTALRRAAAGIEAAERGITFTVNADGRAIVTGPARVKVPARFRRFANDHGLTLVVQRSYGPFVNSNTPMPIAYREAGALYFGEIGENHLDRTGKTRFSKPDQENKARAFDGNGMTAAAVRAEISPILAKWKHGNIQVVQSISELPDSLQREVHAVGAEGDMEGVYVGNGTVYMVADHLQNARRVHEVLAHEAIGHLAAEELTDQADYQRAINSVQTLDRIGNKTIRALGDAVDERQPGLSAKSRAKEIMALAVERGSYRDIPLLQKAITSIVSWVKARLRAMGLNTKWVNSMSEGEVFSMLRQGERRLESEKTGKDGAVSGAAMASRGGVDGIIRRLKWKDSAVLNGLPSYRGDGFSIFATTEIPHEDDFQTHPYALHWGHIAQIPEGSKPYQFTIRGEKGVGAIGDMKADVDGNGNIVAIHDINIYGKRAGIGAKIVASIAANSPSPIKIVEAIPQSQGFWRKVGLNELDDKNTGYISATDAARYILGHERRTAQGFKEGVNRVPTDAGAEGVYREGIETGEVSPEEAGKYQFSRSSIIGASGRAYTPEQLAAMERTGSVVTKKTIQETIKSLWQDAGKKLAQGVFDQFRPVRDLSSHAYTLMRLSKGAPGAFEAFMHHGKLSLRDGAYDADTSGGVMEKVFYPLGKESTDFLRWVAGNRAERLATEGKENLFTPDDIAAFKSLATGDTDFDYTLPNGNVTRNRMLIYRDSLRKFNEFNKNVLDMAEQSGLIDPESRHLWEHEFYVPFYRTVDDNDGGVRGMNIKQGVVRQEAFKKLKGGDEKLNDLLANTLMNWAHLIDASAKNRAATATLQAAVKVGAARLALAGDKKTVWHMSGGQKVEYKVDDPYLLDAISSLEYAGLRGPAMDAMSTMKHWLTVGVTASPFFKVRNLIRDSIQSIATADMGYNPLSNVIKGYKLTDRAAQEYVSALAGGGLIRFGTMLEGNEASRVRQLIKQGASDQHILDSESKLRAFYDKYAEPLISAYEELGNRGEEINRMALYDSLISKGVDHATASLMARDLMDFSMRGTWGTIRFLTQIVPFMNARLQGLYKLRRAAKEDPARFAIVIGGVALASLALLAAYGDDDDWKKREDWDRDNYWWFKIGDVAFRIPKPFEIGAISTLAERTAEYAFDDEMKFKRFSGLVLNNIENQLSMNPVPQLFKPIMDVYSNQDSFTGRPIETMGMEHLAPDYRFNQNTSMIGRGISTAGNTLTGDHFLSPVQVDHLIRSYFGWLGASAVGIADIAVRSASNEPTRPALDYWKTITGSMVSELEGAPSRYVTMMYDQAREIEQAYGTWRELMKEGKQEEAAAYRADNQDELSRYKRVEAIKRQETMLNNRIKFIERSDLDSDEKKARINALRQQQDQVARRL
jgi:N12 class adenine-specific DNA methylase